ncbi:hemicentin-1-like isoform X2 [Scylla paramamosain]
MNIMEDLSVRSQLLSAASTRSAADWLSAAHHCQLQQTTPASHHCLQSCSNHQEMAGIYIILLLGCLGTCMGQGLGGMHTVSEVLWLDDYTQDAMPILVAVGNRQPDEPMYSDVETTTPAPERGTGVAHGTENEGEGESKSPIVNYTGQHFVTEKQGFYIQCNLTLFNQLKWTHDGKPILTGEGGYSIEEATSPQGFKGSRLSVENAHMYHAGEYKCTTFSQRSHTIYVLSADLFSSDLIHWITPGHLFKLSCNMTNDDSTNFTLDWFRDDEKLESNDHIKIITANSSLIINDPTKDDSGIYRCQTRAGIPKDNPLVKNFTVIYFTIRKMTKSIVVTDQEELSLECPVDGKPFPKIVWRKDSVSLLEMKANDSRINFATNENEVPNAKLIISKVDSNDRGNYTCNVTTPFGSYEVFTYVRVKDIYAALWPFLGILVEVLLLGIIIFIFEKRRAKAEFEESDTDQGNDQ